MREMYALCKRNILVFVRDYSAVFFFFFFMLIILLLQVVFLGEMNENSILWALSEYGGERDVLTDEKNAEYLINVWTLAGILIVNTVTVSLTVMQTMIRDEVKGQLASFYVAPVKRIKIHRRIKQSTDAYEKHQNQQYPYFVVLHKHLSTALIQ